MPDAGVGSLGNQDRPSNFALFNTRQKVGQRHSLENVGISEISTINVEMKGPIVAEAISFSFGA